MASFVTFPGAFVGLRQAVDFWVPMDSGSVPWPAWMRSALNPALAGRHCIARPDIRGRAGSLLATTPLTPAPEADAGLAVLNAAGCPCAAVVLFSPGGYAASERRFEAV